MVAVIPHLPEKSQGLLCLISALLEMGFQYSLKYQTLLSKLSSGAFPTSLHTISESFPLLASLLFPHATFVWSSSLSWPLLPSKFS